MHSKLPGTQGSAARKYFSSEEEPERTRCKDAWLAVAYFNG